MAVVTIQQSVAALYVAVFNRAPDAAGLNAWTATITSGKQTFAQVAAGFAAHEVFTAGIGTLSNTDFVAALYQNILGSAGDAGGIATWTNQLNAGKSKADVAALFVQAALTTDIPAMLAAGSLTAAEAAAATVRQQTLTNKADVGIYFANTLGAASNLDPKTVSSSKAGLEADPIYNASKAAIANVTNTAASVQTAKDAIAVAAGSANPAQSLLGGNATLTTGVDTITGTAAADTYTAVIDGGATTTLTAADKINGGAGIDTLNVTVTAGASATNGADISNVEVLNIRALGGAVSLDAASTPGATTVVSDRSTGTLTVTNLATGGTVGVKGNAVTNVGAVTGSYVAAATAANVTIDGGTAAGTGALTILNGAALTSATISSTSAANTVASINFGTGVGTADNVTAVTINAATNLTAAGGIVGLKAGVTNNTLTVAGAATAVNVGALDATIGTVTASGLTTGGLTATLSSNTGIKFVGGAGNDVITSAGVLLAAGASVDAGAGAADRLILTTGIAADTAGKASAALYKGFEELKLNNITQDVSVFTGSAISKLVLDGGAVVQNASAAQAANIQVLNTGTFNIGVTGASTVGQLDTVALTADDGVAATVSTIALGIPTLAGIETLQITAVDNVSVTALTAAPDLTSVKLLGAGQITLATGGVNFAANSTIDASAATGNVGIDASGAQSTALVGLSIKGGAGNDTLVGSAKADVIVGGAGNDLLVSTNGTTGTAATATAAATVATITGTATVGDTLTGGAGNDNFAIGHITITDNASILASVSSITDLNLGTNVVAGAVDGLWFNTTTPATAATIVTLTTAQQTAVTGASDLLSAVNLVLAAASGVNNVATFTYGADTYLVTNADGAATPAFAAADNLVKITGVTGVLDASDIHFV